MPYVQLWSGNSPLTAQPCTQSNPLPVSVSSGNAQSLITSDIYTIGATSTTVTLVSPSTIINFANPSVGMYINFRNSTCTTSNFEIPASSGFRYEGAPIQQFTMMTTSGSGTVSIQAS